MSIPKHKANDGNRTRIASLEGWNSTIELHSQVVPVGSLLPMALDGIEPPTHAASMHCSTN